MLWLFVILALILLWVIPAFRTLQEMDGQPAPRWRIPFLHLIDEPEEAAIVFVLLGIVKRGVKCPQNRDLESLRNRERKVHFFAQELARSEVSSSATNGQKSDKLKGTGAEDRALLESNLSVAPVTVGRGSGLSDRRTCCLNRTLPMVPKAKNSKVSQRNE